MSRLTTSKKKASNYYDKVNVKNKKRLTKGQKNPNDPRFVDKRIKK
jgi:hypothetical protein